MATTVERRPNAELLCATDEEEEVEKFNPTLWVLPFVVALKSRHTPVFSAGHAKVIVGSNPGLKE